MTRPAPKSTAYDARLMRLRVSISSSSGSLDHAPVSCAESSKETRREWRLVPPSVTQATHGVPEAELAGVISAPMLPS